MSSPLVSVVDTLSLVKVRTCAQTLCQAFLNAHLTLDLAFSSSPTFCQLTTMTLVITTCSSPETAYKEGSDVITSRLHSSLGSRQLTFLTFPFFSSAPNAPQLFEKGRHRWIFVYPLSMDRCGKKCTGSHCIAKDGKRDDDSWMSFGCMAVFRDCDSARRTVRMVRAMVGQEGED